MSLPKIKTRSTSLKSLTKNTNNNYNDNGKELLLYKLNHNLLITEPFQINPPQVVFKDIETSKQYQINVQIRNLTKKSQRIRFQPFKNKKFSLKYTMKPQIAPGLIACVNIKYQCEEQVSQSQILKIVSSDGYVSTVNLTTYPKQSKIVFQPFINLGFTQFGKQCVKTLQFLNEGSKSGNIEIINKYPQVLQISQNHIIVQPKEKTFVNVKYKAVQAGIFKGAVQLKSNQILAKNYIQIYATSLDQARFIINPNQILEQPEQLYDFGTIYVGQKKILKAFIVNNSPKKMIFKSIIKKGLLLSTQQFTSIQTPYEQGLQQKQKVFNVYPSSGQIDPFSQFQLNLICESIPNYREKLYVQNYAVADVNEQGSIDAKKNSNNFKQKNDYEYSILIKDQIQPQQASKTESMNKNTMILQLKSNIVCPEIKIDKKFLLFGDCNLKQSKIINFHIQNKNTNSKVQIQFIKIPYYNFNPQKFNLQPNQNIKIQASFHPKVIGKIDSHQILLINRTFQIELRCMGIAKQALQSQSTFGKSIRETNQNIYSSSHSQRSLPKIRMSMPSIMDNLTQNKNEQIFKNDSQLLRSKNKQRHQEKRKQKIILLTQRKLEMGVQVESLKISINKEKYSKILTERRQQRQKKQIQKKMTQKYNQLKKIKSLIKNNEKQDDQGMSEDSPIDIQFQIGSDFISHSKKQKQFFAPLPNSFYKLFVTKPIGQYQLLPIQLTNTGSINNLNQDKIKKSYLDPPKKYYPETPISFNHRRQASTELSPQNLSLIQVLSNRINFGDVFIKSEESRYFWIKNMTRNVISCRLQFKQLQLQKSYKKAQIIPSGQQAGFPIIFYKNSLGELKTSGSYIINDIHRYQIQITVKCVQVDIKIDKTKFNFSYPQKQLELTTSQSITLFNPGNSAAKFKFVPTKQKIFLPEILQGVIQAKKQKKVNILFTSPIPTKKLNQYKYEQKIQFKILDGGQSFIICTITIEDPKYSVKCDMLTTSIHTICIKNEIHDFIELKNTSKTSPTVLHLFVQGQLSNLHISQTKIKLMPDETRKVKLKYTAKQKIQQKGIFVIQPRGGQKKEFHLKFLVIEPIIFFSSQIINLQTLIVKGTPGYSKLSVSHKQKIQIPLTIDLRPKKYSPGNSQQIQNIKFKIIEPQNQTLQVLMPTLKSQQNQNQNIIEEQNLVGKQINVQDFQDSAGQEDQDQILQRDQMQLRKYKIILKPNIQYVFSIQFQALIQKTKYFSIKLPISIQKSITIQNSPIIKYKAIAPKFIFQPSLIDFKKKYIGKPDRTFPKIIMITISNLDQRDIEWEIRQNESNDQNSIKNGLFQLEHSKGFAKKGQKMQMKATFNPFAIGQYEIKFPLYIKTIQKLYSQSSKQQQHVSKENQKMLKYNDIVMKGTAATPQLFFNKRQVLFPVVPLNIQTTTFFRILNDGYDNCSLSYEFCDDIANIDVKVHFPQGNNISMSKQKIRVDLSWKFDRPMSFTIILTFRDQMGKPYNIPVSGTADNSILTNYLYFLRNQRRFKINDDGPLQLIQLTQNQTHTSLHRKHSSHSLKSSATNRSLMSYLGVAPINPYILANTFEYIKKYLNENILIIPIGQFPGTLIQNDGKSILQILSVFSGKNCSKYPWVVSSTSNLKPEQKVRKLYNQYSELIKMLKLQGALLNHIRPQYLLSFSDLNIYLSTIVQKEKSKSYMPSLSKINSGLYKYLSIQSWTTLLYQIIKINLFVRVTPKNFKNHIPSIFSDELKQIPKSHLDQSNFISTAQSILLYWAQESYLQVLLQEKRIINFDKDFKNGLILGSLIQRYTKKNVVSKMIINCKDQNDQKKNAQILCDQLQEIGLLNHIQAKNIYNPLQRQMFMLLMHLYLYLPFYLPNPTPIIFKCCLGQEIIKSIQLKNPTSKTLKYKAKYNGSLDFTLESQTEFNIQPKSSYEFKIKFTSRFSKQVNGKITFINDKDKSSGIGISATALVFQLKSQITEIVNDKIWKISGSLYQVSQFSLQIFNKFTTSETKQFTIKISTFYKYPQKKKPNTQSLTKQQEQSSFLQSPLILKSDTIKIKKNSTAPLSFNYIPMTMYPQKIILLFQNDMIGQFQHQIQATVQQPQLNSQIRPSINLTSEQDQIWDYLINPKNQMLLKARKNIQTIKNKKNKNGSSVSISSQKKTKTSKQNQEQIALGNQKYFIQIETNPYVVLPSFVILNQQKVINQINNHNRKSDINSNIKQELKSKSNTNNQNSIPTQVAQLAQNNLRFKFMCGQPVYQFTINFTLRNQNLTDVRKYKLIFTIMPKPLKADIEFKTPARKQIVQQIPIVNRTEKDWNIKVTFIHDSNKNGNYFYLQSGLSTNFLVKKQSIGELPIAFRPKWLEKAQARLVLNNPITLDQFQYNLHGEGLEPLAQDHIEIKCDIKQIVTRKIELKNPYLQKSITFKVETDISNFKGDSKITVPQNGKATYQFSVQPLVCGDFTNCITFYQNMQGTIPNDNNKSQQYLWYTVQISTNTATAVKTLKFQGQIRKRYHKKIQIPYNQNQKASNTFKVILNGEGLIGPQSIVLYPKTQKSQNIYQFQYLPLQIGQSTGSIYFINQTVGQILINLQLICYQKPAFINHLVKVQLGSFQKLYANLQNPINKSISIKISNSNPTQFIVAPEKQFQKSSLKSSLSQQNNKSEKELNLNQKIKQVKSLKLMPFQTKIVEIFYIPGNLDEIEKASIIFQSQIGKWQFFYSGIGTAPTQFQPLTIYKELKSRDKLKQQQKQPYSNISIPNFIKFKNPFNYAITIGVIMKFQQQITQRSKVFKFQIQDIQKRLFQIQAHGVLELTFRFQPQDLLQYKSKIIIKLSDKIFWSFPIIGIALVYCYDEVFHFKTKCRQISNQNHQIRPYGHQNSKKQKFLKKQNLNNSKKIYQIQLLNIPKQHDYEYYLQRFFLSEFESEKNFIKDQKDQLNLQLIFKPMKPAKFSFNLCLQQKDGPRWMYKVILQAYQPDPDDIIYIESNLMKTTTISFKITNWQKKAADFKAYFTSQSAHQFSVEPSQGSLTKFGSKGTPFYISFTPIQYGKQKNARLIIQTKDMYWSYVLTGSLPKYIPPKGESHISKTFK